MERSQKKELTIKQNMLWNSLGSLANLGCQWLISILIVRMSAGFEAAGIYSLATSIYAMFSPISHYRTYTYQISDVRHQFAVEEYLSFRITTCAICLLAIIGYTLFTCSEDCFISVFLFSVWKLTSMVIDVFHATDQQNHRMDIIGKSLSLQGFVSLLIFTIVYPLLKNLELVLGLMAIFTIAICLVFDIPQTLKLVGFSFRFDIRRIKSLFIICLPAVLGNIAYSASSSLPRQFLANIMGSDSLGVYASIAAPVAILQTGAAYIYNPLIGYFAERYDDNDVKGFVSLLTKAMGGVLLLGLIASIALYYIGPMFLAILYGNQISSYSDLLALLIPASLGMGITGFLNDLLVALRALKQGFISNMLALLTTLILSRRFIKSLGMNGVSLVMIVSCAISLIYMLSVLITLLREKKSVQTNHDNSDKVHA